MYTFISNITVMKPASVLTESLNNKLNIHLVKLISIKKYNAKHTILYNKLTNVNEIFTLFTITKKSRPKTRSKTQMMKKNY